MENTEKCQQRAALSLFDSTLFFLVLIILSVLLSFWATVIQRRTLVCTMAGVKIDTSEQVFRIRRTAGVLVVVGLGFFFRVALLRLSAAQDCESKDSAWIGVLTAFLVLVAAVMRLLELDRQEASRQTQALETDVQPE